MLKQINNAAKHLKARNTQRELKKQKKALQKLEHAYETDKELCTCPLCKATDFSWTRSHISCYKCVWLSEFKCEEWFKTYVDVGAIVFRQVVDKRTEKMVKKRLSKLYLQMAIIDTAIELYNKK